jgi:hypothetical protein
MQGGAEICQIPLDLFSFARVLVLSHFKSFQTFSVPGSVGSPLERVINLSANLGISLMKNGIGFQEGLTEIIIKSWTGVARWFIFIPKTPIMVFLGWKSLV